MRVILILTWLLLPVAGLFYHGGPGQKQLVLDDAAKHLAAADAHFAAEEWFQAEHEYEAALRLLPQEQTQDRQRVRLQRAKTQFQTAKLPQAYLELHSLIDELQDDESADPALLADTSGTLANAQYYVTWLMRLEGRPREDWEPEIEAARQSYKWLAEEAELAGDGVTMAERTEDLEAAIRLARIDLAELQGQSIPKQCQGCCSGDCKGMGKKRGRGKKGKQKEDARGASSGPPPDDGGS